MIEAGAATGDMQSRATSSPHTPKGPCFKVPVLGFVLKDECESARHMGFKAFLAEGRELGSMRSPPFWVVL